MNWNRATIASAFAAPLILLFWWGFSRDPAVIPSPLPGHTAPMFALQVFAPGEPPLARPVGDTMRLSDLRGQIVVVNFWASWCIPACSSEHATLSEVARSYEGRPVRFIGVLFNDKPLGGLEFISKLGGQTYPSVDDPKARTAIDYGVYGVPETFFIDALGRVAYKYTGPVTAGLLTHYVDSLIAAAPSVKGELKGTP